MMDKVRFVSIGQWRECDVVGGELKIRVAKVHGQRRG